MLSSLFIEYVQEAVAQSTQKDLCLVVFVTDSSQTDGNNWLQKWFHLNNDITINHLKTMATWLRLVEGTQELQYFEQIFPGVVVPSLYLIYRGEIKLLLMDDPNDDVETVKGYWDQLMNTLKENTPRMNVANINQASPFPPSTPLVSETNATSPANTKHDRTFKEQVEETTQQMYKEKVAKERRMDLEEKERILRLVKADKEERKARKHERELQQEHPLQTDDVVIPDLNVHDNIKNVQILHSVNCILQIKLTNGNSIKHTFNHDDTLNEVRKWVDQNRTDGDLPYAFHRNIPRYTFQDSDELKTLESLELTPRSLLILKPLETRQNPLNISEVENPGLFGKVYNSFSSFWGRNNEPNTTTQGLWGPSSFNDSDVNLHDNSIINTRYEQSSNYETQNNENTPNPASRSLTPNVYQFHNTDDNVDEDKEKETYNGNAIKLEKRPEDKDK
ncbi:UBX domain-containing protein 7 [Monosporozyma unispora]